MKEIASKQANGLEIITDDSLSIKELTNRQAEGYSVMRSAHAGNLLPYNLTLLEEGVPVLSVDQTITGVDKSYYPERISSQDSCEMIAPLDKLVSRAIVDTIPEDVQGLLVDSPKYVDELHLQAVREIMEGANIFTSTEYARLNEEVVREIVASTLEEAPAHFNRLVMPDGSVVRRPDAAQLVETYGILQLNDDPREAKEAVIMPNVVNILANFVVESLTTEKEVQYHLSGPAMVKYIGGLMPDLQKIYANLKKEAPYGDLLPTHLRVILVPTAHARFATTHERRELLEELLASLTVADEELMSLQEKRRQFFGSGASQDNEVRQRFLEGARASQASIEIEVVERLAALPELFAEPGSPAAITQYDVQKGGGLYIADINTQQSMAELAALFERLKKLKGRYKL